MIKLPKKELKQLFEDIVSESKAKCGKSNPFILEKENFNCYVFIKNISPAYYVNYPDNSRVQLPSSERFKEIINSNLDFLIIGYDGENEVFAAWDPNLIKDRLNEKSNVSVYSRFSWQSKVPMGEFKHHHLSNKDKVILFKKELLNDFFEDYSNLFNLSKNDITKDDDKEKSKFDFDLEIVKSSIDPLLKEHKVLQAVTVLENLLKNKSEYNQLSFKDYFRIVNKIYTDLHS